MGDISEMRGLVVSITFLGVLALLITWMPSELYSPPSFRNVATPDLFESFDVWSFAETFTLQLNETGGWTIGTMYYIFDSGLDIGNRDFTYYYREANETPLETKMQLNWLYFFFPQLETMEWMNQQGESRGTILSVAEMESDTVNATVQYRVKSNVWNFQYFASFSYNETKWANYSEAWNHHELYFFWAVNFDQVNTSYNVTQLITMLLFYGLPDVNVFINLLMAIPMWVCIAYLVYIIILRAIGAIFGGGA